MKPTLVPLLRCPTCRNDDPLSLAGRADQGNEIDSGSLHCEGCGASFHIVDGIVDLLTACSAAASGEREVYLRSRDEVWRRICDLSADARDEELRKIAFMEHTGEQFRLTSTLNLDGALASIDPLPGQWLVELGAGSGWLTARWAARGVHCVATDISVDLKLELSPMVMRASGVYFDRVLADMTNLPIRSSSVDWVFVSASLHHAGSLGASLTEVARVLAPDGALVAINEPMHGLVRRSGKRFVDQAAEENPGLNEQSFTYFQWRHALRAAGLRARFLFPPYYRAVLEGRVGPPASSRSFARLAGHVWRSPLRRMALSSSALAAAQVLFGLNVCMVARKGHAA